MIYSERFELDNDCYHKMTEQARDIIFITAADGEIIYANQAAVKAYGYSGDELRRMHIRELRSPETLSVIERQIAEAWREGALFRSVHMRKNGERFPVEVSSRLLQLPSGEAAISIVRDITAAVALETAFKHSEEKHRDLYTELKLTHEELTAAYEELSAIDEEVRHQYDELLARDAAIRKQNSILTSLHNTAAGLIQRRNPEDLLRLIIADATELIGTPHGFIYRLDKQKGSFCRSHGLGIYENDLGREIPIQEGIVGNVYKTGQPVVVNDYHAWRTSNPASVQFAEIRSVLQIPLKSEGQVVGTIGLAYCESEQTLGKDEIESLSMFAELASVALDNALLIKSLENELTERKAHEQAIWRLAYLDLLTGLPNRLYFHEHLEREIEKARTGETSGAVLHIDLDDLQEVNDTLGHAFGDAVIMEAGIRIVEGAGEKSLVARVAGDEYMIMVFNETERAKVVNIAERIVKLVDRAYEIDETRVHVTASVGIALFPNDGGAKADVLRKADLALHAAKASGKNTWRFCEAQSQAVTFENMLLKRGLREAIEREEFSLNFQPLIDASSGCVISFEVLLRWNSLEFGAVSPGRFIPLAEESEIIVKIGKWVIEQACSFARQLTAMGKSDVRVAVNVSPRQLVAATSSNLSVRRSAAPE